MWFIALWAPLHVAGTSSGTQYIVSDRRGQNGFSINAAFDEQSPDRARCLVRQCDGDKLEWFPRHQTGKPGRQLYAAFAQLEDRCRTDDEERSELLVASL